MLKVSHKKSSRDILKDRRKMRARKKISGTAERPRLSVCRSAKHVYCQVIDDSLGCTLAFASSFEKGNHKRANIEICKEIGTRLAERCKEKNIQKIVFDKNGNDYCGRVAALADAARAAGLVF